MNRSPFFGGCGGIHQLVHLHHVAAAQHLPMERLLGKVREAKGYVKATDAARVGKRAEGRPGKASRARLPVQTTPAPCSCQYVAKALSRGHHVGHTALSTAPAV